MSQASFNLVRDFMASLTTADWQRISWANLHGLKFLHSISLDYLFIKAASSFWDPREHVFRLQGQELCPLPEEFMAILGVSFPSHTPLALPRLPSPYAAQLKHYLHLTQEEISNILISPNRVSIAYLLELTVRRERTSLSWSRLTTLVLLSQFLMISVDGDCDCSLLGIVEDMENGHNPFLVVSAETFHGLDRVSVRSNERFSGSPLLLQIWLQEKLALVDPPTVPFHKYKPKNHKSRRLLKAASSFDEWVSRLGTLSDTVIRWVCPWWQITHVTLETYASCVPLAGLHDSSFYIPSLLCRQYGQKQRRVTRLSTFQGGPVTTRFLVHMQDIWTRRRILFGISLQGDILTDDDYKVWVEQKRLGNDEGTSSSSKRART